MRNNPPLTNKIFSFAAGALLGCLFILLFADDAHAYLNPGSGSFIFQLILAAFLGGLLTVRLYWSKVREFFKRLFLRGKKQ
jgi:hypothetical protein